MRRIRNSIKALIVAICVAVVAVGAIVGVVIVNNKKGSSPQTPGNSSLLDKVELKKLEEDLISASSTQKTIDIVDDSIFSSICDIDNLVYLGEKYFIYNTQSDGNGDEKYVYFKKKADGTYDYKFLSNKTNDDTLGQTPGFVHKNAVDFYIEIFNDYGVVYSVTSQTVYDEGTEDEYVFDDEYEYKIIYLGDDDVKEIFSYSTIDRTEDYVSIETFSVGGKFFTFSEFIGVLNEGGDPENEDDYTISTKTYVCRLEQSKKSLDEITVKSFDGDDVYVSAYDDVFVVYTEGKIEFFAEFDGELKTFEILDSENSENSIENIKTNVFLVTETSQATADDPKAILYDADENTYIKYAYSLVEYQNGKFVETKINLKDGYASANIEFISENSNAYYVCQYGYENSEYSSEIIYQYFGSNGNLLFEYQTDRTDRIQSISDSVFVTTKGVFVITNDLVIEQKLSFETGTYYSLEGFSNDYRYVIYKYNGQYGILDSNGDFVIDAKTNLENEIYLSNIETIVGDYALIVDESFETGTKVNRYYLINCKTGEKKEIKNVYTDPVVGNLFDVGYNFYLTKDSNGKVSLYQNETLKFDNITEITYAQNYATGVLLKIKSNGQICYLELKNGNSISFEDETISSEEAMQVNSIESSSNEYSEKATSIDWTTKSYYGYTKKTSSGSEKTSKYYVEAADGSYTVTGLDSDLEDKLITIEHIQYKYAIKHKFIVTWYTYNTYANLHVDLGHYKLLSKLEFKTHYYTWNSNKSVDMYWKISGSYIEDFCDNGITESRFKSIKSQHTDLSNNNLYDITMNSVVELNEDDLTSRFYNTFNLWLNNTHCYNYFDFAYDTNYKGIDYGATIYFDYDKGVKPGAYGTPQSKPAYYWVGKKDDKYKINTDAIYSETVDAFNYYFDKKTAETDTMIYEGNYYVENDKIKAVSGYKKITKGQIYYTPKSEYSKSGYKIVGVNATYAYWKSSEKKFGNYTDSDVSTNGFYVKYKPTYIYQNIYGTSYLLDIVVFPKYEKLEYKVTLDLDMTDGQIDDQIMYKTEINQGYYYYNKDTKKYVLLDASIIKDNKIDTEKNGFIVYDQIIYYNTSQNQSTPSYTKHFYYEYNANEDKVRTYIYDNNTIKRNITNTITIPKRYGYTFDGYYYENGSSSVKVVESNGNVLSDKLIWTTNVTLKAHWIPNDTTIEFVFGTSDNTNLNTPVYGIMYDENISGESGDGVYSDANKSIQNILTKGTSPFTVNGTAITDSKMKSDYKAVNYGYDSTADGGKHRLTYTFSYNESTVIRNLMSTTSSYDWKGTLGANANSTNSNSSIAVTQSSTGFAKWLLQDTGSDGKTHYYDVSINGNDKSLLDYFKAHSNDTTITLVACYKEQPYNVRYDALVVSGNSSGTNVDSSGGPWKYIKQVDSSTASYTAQYSIDSDTASTGIEAEQYINPYLYGKFTISINLSENYIFDSIILANYFVYESGSHKNCYVVIQSTSSNNVKIYVSTEKKDGVYIYADAVSMSQDGNGYFYYGDLENNHRTKFKITGFSDTNVSITFEDVSFSNDNDSYSNADYQSPTDYGFNIMACAKSIGVVKDVKEDGGNITNGADSQYGVQQLQKITSNTYTDAFASINRKIATSGTATNNYAFWLGYRMFYIDGLSLGDGYGDWFSYSGTISAKSYNLKLSTGQSQSGMNFYIVNKGGNYYAYYSYSDATQYGYDYQNTKVIALSPDQKIFNMATSTTGSKSNDKNYYDLTSYLTSLTLGEKGYTIGISRDVSAPTSGEYTKLTMGEYKISVSEKNATSITSNSIDIKYNYLGETYTLTQRFDLGDYTLFFGSTGKTSSYKYKYFIFDNTVGTKSNSKTVTYKFENFNKSVSIEVNDNGDLWDSVAHPVDVIYQNNSELSLSDWTSDSNKHNLSVKNIQPSTFSYFRFTPHDGYLIKKVKFTYGSKTLFDVELNTVGYNNNNNTYFNDATTINYAGTTSNLSAYTVSGGKYGIYFGTSDGTSAYIESPTPAFESLFIVIAGISENVKIEIETVSFVEYIFADNYNLLYYPYRETDAYSNTISSLKLSMLVKTTDGAWKKLGIDQTTSLTTDYRPKGTATDSLFDYDASYIVLSNNLARVAFMGKAYLFKQGLRIYASGDDYSTAFSNPRVYGGSDNAFSSIAVQGSGVISQAVGTTGTSNIGTYIVDGDKILLYEFAGSANMVDSIFNGSSTTEKHIFSKKYLLKFTCSVHTSNTYTNSYLSNSTTSTTFVPNSDVFDSTTFDKDNYTYKTYDWEKAKSNVYFNYSIIGSQYYQLDYVSTNHKKRYSWFNDTVLTNIDIGFNLNGGSVSTNWQMINKGDKDKEGGVVKDGQERYGYKLQYVYRETAGYYLHYIKIYLKNFDKVITLDVSGLMTKSKNLEINKFSDKLQIQGNNNVIYKFYYEFEYNTTAGEYTFRFYPQNSTDYDSICNSIALLSNEIHVNFYSDAYTGEINLNNYNDNGKISSTKVTGKTETFTYDTLSTISTSGWKMDGYTFIGFASKNDIDDSSRFSERTETTANTWNSTSSFECMESYFKYGKDDKGKSIRGNLLDLKTTEIKYYDFYISDDKGFKFITDTGFASGTEKQNYNFWCVYAKSFAQTIGKGHSSKIKQFTFDLYSIWKANTYRLAFNFNDSNNGNGTTTAVANMEGAGFGGTRLNNLDGGNQLTFGYTSSTTTYYFYVTYDSQNWYATTNENYSYKEDTFDIYNSTNKFNFLVDRFGYTWLGWITNKDRANIKEGSTIENSDTVFGSCYNNYFNCNSVPVFNNTLLQQFSTKNEITTPAFYYKNQLGISESKWGNIYFYNYNGGKASDYLNLDTSTEVTYFDTALSADAYSYENDTIKISHYNSSGKLYYTRFVTLYAYWEQNAYYVVYDFRAGTGKDNGGLKSIDAIGSSNISNKDSLSQTPLKLIWFDDEESYKDGFLSEIPTRIGYDFLGYSFDFTVGESVSVYNGASNNNLKYLLEEKMLSLSGINQYSLYVNGAGGDSLISSTLGNGSKFSSIKSTSLETLGGGKDATVKGGTTVGYVYLFAIWQQQTFVSNISMNITGNEAGYEQNNSYMLGSYVNNGDNNYSSYTMFNREYLKNNTNNETNTYADIASNIQFVFTFDGNYTDAYCTYNNNRYYLKDLFALSMGYYFDGWSITPNGKLSDSSTTLDALLVANALKSYLNEDGLLSSGNSSGSQIFNETVFGTTKYKFDYEFYKKLYRSNYVAGQNKANHLVGTGDDNAWQKLSSQDGASESTNFGYITIAGKKHYLQTEYKNEEYSMYFFYDEDLTQNKYSSNIKLYVVPYYLDNNNKTLINFDNEFLYYNNLPIQFDSINNCYYVSSDWSSRVIVNVRFAVYSESDYLAGKNSLTSLIRSKTGMLSYSEGTVSTIKFKFNSDSSERTALVSCGSTRQFTLYAMWTIKSDRDITISNGSIKSCDSYTSDDQPITNKYRFNDGLEGLYEIKESKGETSVGSSITENYNTEIANRTAQDQLSHTFTYNNKLDLQILPFYNGRFLSEMSFAFYGIEPNAESESDSTKPTYKLVKYTLVYKFDWNNSTHSLNIVSISISSTNGLNTSLLLDSSVVEGKDAFNASAVNKQLYNSDQSIERNKNVSVFSLIQGNSSAWKKDGIYTYFTLMKILGYADTAKVENFGRKDINKLQINLSDVKSNIEINCKFSVQTYEVQMYNFLDSNGNNLAKKGDIYTTIYSEEEFSTKVETAMAEGYDPYISSASAIKTNLATIRTNLESSSYNVPYGYFIYGQYYQKTSKPVSESEWSDYSSLIAQYYGFNYIYADGNYINGMVTNAVLKEVDSDKFYSQCSGLLGKDDAVNSILLNLSAYTFGGWYTMYSSSGEFVELKNYDKACEASYINKNLTLYGYYYAISRPTNIKFYTWDKDNGAYSLYAGNQNEYMLNSNVTNKIFKISGNEIYLDENVEVYKDSLGDLMLSTFESYGVDSSAFNNENFTTTAFRNNGSDLSVLSKLLNTYWYYRTGYKKLYDAELNAYVKYDDGKYTCNGVEVTVYCSNVQNDTYFYVVNSDSSTNHNLKVVDVYEYNFVGAEPYISIYAKGTTNYYKLTRTTSEYFEALNNEALTTANPAYYAVINGTTYYVLPQYTTGSIWNGNSNSIYDSNGVIQNLILDSGDISIAILKNYNIKFNEAYYPVSYIENTIGSEGYVSGDSLCILDPTSHAGTVKLDIDGNGEETYYFDFNTRELYNDVGLSTKSSFKYSVYSAMNDNYLINAKLNTLGSGWVYGGVTVQSLPSKNVGYWYNDPNYGAVGFIEVTSNDLDEIRGKFDSDLNAYTGVRAVVEDLVNTLYADRGQEFREGLMSLYFSKIDSYDIKSNVLVPKSYSFDSSKTVTRIKISIPFSLVVTYSYGGITQDYPLSTNYDYDFSVVSKNTSVDGDIDAIQVYSPYAMKFNESSVSSSGETISIETANMEVNHFESKDGGAYIYQQKFVWDVQNNYTVEGDMLHLVLLTSSEMEQLKELYINADGKLDLALNILLRSVKTSDSSRIVHQAGEAGGYATKLSFDITSSGDYYIFAYYNKTGLDESSSYVTRVSDNFVKVTKTDSGFTAPEIVETSSEMQ